MIAGTKLNPDSQVADLSAAIKQYSLELGFSVCRITSADPPPHHANYKDWLDNGHSGEMEYLKRQEPKRSSPDAVLKGARSIICLAVNYAVETGRPANTGNGNATAGTVARYARYEDYHHRIWQMLDLIVQRIDEIAPGVGSKAYCDTGPITERDLAMRAGVGWIGKHTNLISRELGNWFFLAEILTDAVLEIDVPETTHCGTCTRCIPACPTGAITGPYLLDARKCISYLTIELKGSIPVEFRPLIGRRIYGCDECLAVCPWNKFAVEANKRVLTQRDDLKEPDLVELLHLTEETFKTRFRGSPILRTKRRGFLRNVCVATGNARLREALPQLNHLVQHEPEELVKEHAQWAIDQVLSVPAD